MIDYAHFLSVVNGTAKHGSTKLGLNSIHPPSTAGELELERRGQSPGRKKESWPPPPSLPTFPRNEMFVTQAQVLHSLIYHRRLGGYKYGE